MKVKRCVFYVDEKERERVKQFLNVNNIIWSGKGYFKWDWNTAIAMGMITGLLFVIIIAVG